MRDLLGRDVVAYGGYSAGVCILGPTLQGVNLMDDNETAVPAGYDPEVLWDGLGLLPYAVGPHYQSPSHPGTDLVPLALAFWTERHIPFVALRDGEAIVRNGEREAVL